MSMCATDPKVASLIMVGRRENPSYIDFLPSKSICRGMSNVDCASFNFVIMSLFGENSGGEGKHVPTDNVYTSLKMVSSFRPPIIYIFLPTNKALCCPRAAGMSP